MAYLIILLPLAMAALALVVGSNRRRPWLLPAAALPHLVLTLCAVSRCTGEAPHGWLALDPAGRLVLLLSSVLFLACAVYAVGYLRYRQERPNRICCACLLSFLAMMSLAAWAQHLGLMWVALEAAALVTAPLIYFNHTARSIEATWKYLLIGSVGIALALLGSYFLAFAALAEGHSTSLVLADLVAAAPGFSKPWLHATFVLLLVGYGTKMGLAPMHTWKPDAYGEAPGLVGALLAGCLTNVAFLAILRIYQICVAAGEGAFAGRLLIGLGLFSMAVAGVFMVGQKDFKRILAYSSVEHMGILVLGLGIGGGMAIYGSLLHMLNNGLTKGVLFLAAGSIHRAFGSKSTDDVSGAIRRLPVSGTLFLVAFLAIAGMPPFGPFISLFAILDAAFGSGRFIVGGLYLGLLLLAFTGMGATVLAVVQGKATQPDAVSAYRDGWLTALPPLVLIALVLCLGLSIPGPLRAMLADAVQSLQVTP